MLFNFTLLFIYLFINFFVFITYFDFIYIGDNKEEGENEVGEQPRRYRQPRQQNWYNSYRGNRRGPPPNRGEGGDYNNVRIVFIINFEIESNPRFHKFLNMNDNLFDI